VERGWKEKGGKTEEVKKARGKEKRKGERERKNRVDVFFDQFYYS